MSADPFIGEISMFAGPYAPQGWAFCDGGILSIAEHTALFAIIGTTYGGDGVRNFALPDLRGRAPVHKGRGPGAPDIRLGEMGGESAHTLTTNELPGHTHAATGKIAASSAAGSSNSPANAFPAVSASRDVQYATTADTQMNANASQVTVASTGGSAPHNNMQPYLGINFIIALQGLFPSRS